MKDPYMVYVEKYGKVQSGNKLDRIDYGEVETEGFVEYDDNGKLAVSIAAQDVKMKLPLRSKDDFEKQINRLMSK